MNRLRSWAAALFVAWVTLASASAQAPAPAAAFDAEAQHRRYAEAWASADGLFDLEALGALYASDPGAVFFDEYMRTPQDWSFSRLFARGRQPVAQGVASLRLAPSTPARVVAMSEGRVVTVGAYRLDARFEGMAPMSGTLRHTAVWERRGDDWVLIHEHRSIPLEDLY